MSGERSREREHLPFWDLVALVELMVIAAPAALAVYSTVVSACRRTTLPGGAIRAWAVAAMSLCARGKPVTLEARLIRMTRE